MIFAFMIWKSTIKVPKWNQVMLWVIKIWLWWQWWWCRCFCCCWIRWWWWQQEPPSQAQWFYEWDIFLGQRSLSQRITSHYLSHHPTLPQSVFVIPHTFIIHIKHFTFHTSHFQVFHTFTFHISHMLSNIFPLFKQANCARFDAITLYKSSLSYIDISIRQITSICNVFWSFICSNDILKYQGKWKKVSALICLSNAT